MDTKTFLQTVLGEEGWYCVFAAKDGKVKQKFYEEQKFVEKVGGQFDSNEYDTYFALATFKEPDSRKASNVQQIRSFYIDLDCGKSKEYASQRDALSALRDFCQGQGFPRPLTVNSGRGIHAYWPLTEPVSAEQWQPVADSFKQLCFDAELRIDPAVTADSARVLRLPGTHNYKGEPKPAHVLGMCPEPIDFEDFKAMVGKRVEIKPRVKGALFEDTITTHDNAVLGILAGNSQSRFRKIIEKTAKGKGCLQLGALVKHQEDTPEPLWRAGLSIAKFCVDGEKAIHIISRNYPEYDADATERKANAIKGPYLCTKFDELSPGGCEGCPNRGKIKSPIVLGREVLEAEEEDNIYEEPEEVERAPDLPDNVIPSYPKPYFRGKNGGVYLRTHTVDGDVDERVVYHNDLYVTRRIRDPELGECLVIRLHLPRDGVREFLLPLSSATSREEFRKEMARQGVAVLKMDDLMGYISEWVNDLQAKTIADEARMQFGWTPGLSSFVLGQYEYKKGRVDVNHPSSATAQYFPSFEPKGTLEGWKEAMRFYNQPGLEFHQLMIGAGFGSVLMELMPNINAAMVHIYSTDSGFGKTTLKWAMASIWGNYRELVITSDDTRNFAMNRAEIGKNLPLLIDEVTNAKPEVLSDLAYTVTGGKQRGRLSSSINRERRRGDPWSLLAVTSANESFIEKITALKHAPQAEAQRVLEKRVQKFEGAGKLQTDEFNKMLSENYGHAGPIFVQYVIDNIGSVRDLLFKVQETLDKKYKLNHQNRYWSAFLACSLTGAAIARRLGLLEFEGKGLFHESGLLIEENRENGFTLRPDIVETLNNYVNRHWNDVLKIKSSEDLRAYNGVEGLDKLIAPVAQPRGELVARYETDTKKLFLVLAPLRDWCLKRHLSYSSFQADLMKTMGAEKKKCRISKGTHLNMPATTVLVIDCKEFMDDLPIDEKVKEELSQAGETGEGA